MTSRFYCGLCLSIALIAGCAGLPRADDYTADGGALNVLADRLILVTVANPAGPLRLEAGSTFQSYGAGNVYAGGDAARATAEALARDYGLRQIRQWPIAQLKVQCLVFAIPTQAQRATVLSRLATDKRVRLAQPLQTFDALGAASSPAPLGALGAPAELATAATPAPFNDPYLHLQWGFAAIDAGAAQQWSHGDGVRVAIIDTGVDTHHPDLADRIATTRNFVDDDRQSFDRDRHGTEVAGVIAAVANNRIGIAGVAPGVRLQLYKACASQPQSAEARCNSFTLALALSAAIEARAQIVNLSLGGPADPLLTQLIDYGQRRGMVFVGAAPPDELRHGFPTGVEGVIAVDAARRSGVSSEMLYAPGTDILSLTPGGHYDFASGSSLAAAHVTGALALLRARAPQLNALALFALLERTQTRGDSDGEVYGGDLIDICAALAAWQPQYGCAPRSPAVHVATQAR